MNNLDNTLPGLMHRATENLEPVSTDLLERSVQQGLRLRRRRTTLATVAGASAVLATAGLVVGATQLVGRAPDTAVAGTTTPTPSATPQTPSAKPVTGKDALTTLQALIQAPGLTLSKPQRWGDKGAVGAAYVVNDGKGASRIEVLLTGGGEGNRCAEADADCTTLPDGSQLFTMTDTPEYPGNNVHGVVSNYVTRYLPDGRFMSLTSYNAASEKGSQHTRPKPLFTVAQLSTLIQSKSWQLPAKSTAVKGGPAPSKTK
jgi:hypothetical protein